MHATADAHQHHHEMPESGGELTRVALSATLHCLTGCAIGEVLGMIIGTALGFSDLGTIALAVALAFLFGYTLTSLPLLRADLTLGAVIPIALASDTLSIAVMEIVDNAIMVIVPGAMGAGLDNLLFWGALAFALVVAGAFALPVNRWLIARGKGHAVVHATGVHGGVAPRVVGVAAAVAFVFGTSVLVAEGFGNEQPSHDGGHSAASTASAEPVDRAFVAQMVPHHQSAVEMAVIAQRRGSSAFVERLAAGAFDRAFMRMMIPHHEGAVVMARAELAKGKDAELKTLTQNIIATQQREIAAMRSQLGDAAAGKTSDEHGAGHGG